MDINTIMQNIDANAKADIRASKEFWKNQPEEVVNETVENVDIYQRDVNKRRENAKKEFPHGSSQIVAYAVDRVVRGDGAEGLAHAYKRARDDSDFLRERGERDRAEIRRHQYMEEHFWPAVEIVANSASPDELLANKRALDILDKYALLEGSGKGYTAGYIRKAYGDQLGQVEGRSDDYIRSEVRKLNRLMDAGRIRESYGLARKLKDKIERGENIADDMDFELIGRVVAYYG